ncbi:hypothetical protein GGR56DRAFT_283243 [Xylariaceae sp. FL0804]|nr:hypothetical protein GGR56DRAFT_283243 [Xylariaceae sp. FL0804]
MPRLSAARYGKDNVRVYKVHRDPATGTHTVTEMTVCCLLEGDIDASYTAADNASIVATDSIKNTIYIKAREHPVNPPELFAATLGQHFLDTYAHIHTAHVDVKVAGWARMAIDGEGKGSQPQPQPHPHSFHRASDLGSRTASARVSRAAGVELRSGLAGLGVLKSTGSQFHGFVRDGFTTLAETWDRVLSTDVDASWSWRAFPSAAELMKSGDEAQAHVAAFDAAFDAARAITLRTFAEEDSPSVQNTMYKMCEKLLEAAPGVESVAYSLPNKHYFEIDLSWHNGLKNTGEDAEVYAPQSGPNGLIKCEVSRS